VPPPNGPADARFLLSNAGFLSPPAPASWTDGPLPFARRRSRDATELPQPELLSKPSVLRLQPPAPRNQTVTPLLQGLAAALRPFQPPEQGRVGLLQLRVPSLELLQAFDQHRVGRLQLVQPLQQSPPATAHHRLPLRTRLCFLAKLAEQRSRRPASPERVRTPRPACRLGLRPAQPVSCVRPLRAHDGRNRLTSARSANISSSHGGKQLRFGDDLHAGLARAGLVGARVSAGNPRFPTILGPFLEAYIQSRRDSVKARTLDIFERTRRSLVQYFGASKPLREITAGDAKLWREWLCREGRCDGGPLAENTVADRCKKARQFYQFAVDLELISQNPFAGLPGTVRANKAKWFFVTREMAQRVLEACPDAEWRCLFALCRFGGLRRPSEELTLRWEDVDWEHDRFVVHSPKTKHHSGKATRVVPIFPELRSYLEEAWEMADEGAEFVVARSRSQEANLRTQLIRIIQRAGLKPWPAVFHNLRRS